MFIFWNCGANAKALPRHSIFYKTIKVDLILLDVEMPGMTGLEFIRTLTDPPLFILVSSNKDYAVEGYDLRVADYLVKPVNGQELLAKIAAL